MVASSLGEWAALATAVCWTASSTFFTFGSRQVGAATVNRLRLLLASAFLVATHALLYASPIPDRAEPMRWFWLGLSGIVGLAIGDAFLFQSYIWIGPRLSMLVMSIVPLISAGAAWVTLGERLAPLEWLGVWLTMAGIAWVVWERRRQEPAEGGQPDLRRGVLAALGAAAGQAVGLVLAKRGLAGDFPALSANVIRMLTATAAIWAVTAIRGQAGKPLSQLRAIPSAGLPILGGAFTGPFVGVWLSLYSIQHTQIGIASTLMALPPVFLLPVARLVFRERFGWQAVAGTLVAMLGVGLLFMAGS